MNDLHRIAEDAALAAMDAVLDHIEHPRRKVTGSNYPHQSPELATWHLALAVGDDVRLAVLSGAAHPII